MKERINEFVAAYVLPTAVVGTSLALLANVGVHAVRANFTRTATFPKHAIETRLDPLPRDRFDFLEPYSCQMVQYGFPDNVEDKIEKEFGEKSKAFFDALRARGYFPSLDIMQQLGSLNAGKGYDLGVVEGSDRWILTYRTADAPSPFQHGFTLIEAGTNQSVKERFGNDYSPKPGEMNYFVMNPQGMIEYVVILDPASEKNCIVLRPQQLMFRVWGQGSQWENLGFTQTQKSVARKLEEIARNPNRDLLRPVN